MDGEWERKQAWQLKDDYFYTFNEYMKRDNNPLTASMEDYLEMIYRLSMGNGFTRINELSQSLNVQPPSSSKMVQRLAQLKLLKYEKYGFIILTEKGTRVGEGLLKRHLIVENFLKLIGVDVKNVLSETEKIEHTASPQTSKCMQCMAEFFSKNPHILDEYKTFHCEYMKK